MKIKPKANGRYYNLRPKVYKNKVYAIEITSNINDRYSKTYILHDHAGLYQHTLSNAQMAYIEELTKDASFKF